jgi:L-alanine-DL-glutamate epimerase-like enolase superfamily enzyme
LPAIQDIDIEDKDRIFKHLHSCVAKNSSAKACVDMALYDILSKSSGVPLYEYLGGEKKSIKTNLTISLTTPEKMLQDSILAYEDGFEILKVKVGKDINDTVETIKLIRLALPNIIIRVDANQAWDEKSSLAIIDKIYDFNIELIEQPVLANDLTALKNITAHSAIPILADESLFCLEDAVNICENKLANYINIKLMKTGGIYSAKKIVAVAKKHDVKIMMGSMLESVISISAGVHFALCDNIICLFDLDGPLLAKPSTIQNSLIFDKDTISLESNIGLGIKSSPF